MKRAPKPQLNLTYRLPLHFQNHVQCLTHTCKCKMTTDYFLLSVKIIFLVSTAIIAFFSYIANTFSAWSKALHKNVFFEIGI